MSNKKEVKTIPAGIGDSVTITYACMEANNEKSEIKVEGNEFNNKLLRESQGFKEDSNGIMKLNASDNEVLIDESNKTVERRIDGKTAPVVRDGKAETTVIVDLSKLARLIAKAREEKAVKAGKQEDEMTI